LQRRVRGVTEEHDPAFVPMPHGIAVSNGATPPEIHHCIQRAHRRMSIAVYVLKLAAASRGIGLLGVARCTKHGHDVELRAVAQWIMNDVVARPAPQHNAVAWDINL
jgi:hypothetical protein